MSECTIIIVFFITYLTLKWTIKFSSVLNMCDGGYQNDRSSDAKPKRIWYTGKIPGRRDQIQYIIIA